VTPRVIFNAYPDSLSGRLSGSVRFLSDARVKGVFDGFYIMPTIYQTDLDRGFSVVAYALDRAVADEDDLAALRGMDISLMLDLVLNHISVQSKEFRDLLEKGEASEYRDFFIDWNRFWEGHGTMNDEGVIEPYPELIADMNFRKPELPVLKVRMPDGRDVPYWNTFYQKVIWPKPDAATVSAQTGVSEEEAASACAAFERDRDLRALDPRIAGYLLANRSYLGQMDLNVQDARVWRYYAETLSTFAPHDARVVRLDAFVRLHKAVGRANFMNEPETWEILDRLRGMAEARGMQVLPEIHSPYETGAYRKLHALGCAGYDYFLPGLIIDALDSKDPTYLCAWISEIVCDGLRTVNMLGCHDGIPIRDLKGLLPEERRMALVQRIEARGGIAKLIHGRQTEVYQMCATYLSALGGDTRRLLLARAIQVFTPGANQVWYMDLLARENDAEALRDGADAREINRSVLSEACVDASLARDVVQAQLRLLRMKREHPAFAEGAHVQVRLTGAHAFEIAWKYGTARARLYADLETEGFWVETGEG